jgi:small subunit ribosomal protein S17
MAAQKTETKNEATKAAATPMAGEVKSDSKRSTKVGVVVSNKMAKTVVVAVENLVKHGMYQKYIKRTSKFLAHCEANDCNVGDRVVIEETRPLSKRKRWNVREIVSRAS